MSYAWEEAEYDSLSLLEAQTYMRWVLRAMHDTARSLATLRDAEVDAKKEYEAARRRLMLSPECPRVERGGYTVADRDAWVDERCADQRTAYEVATAARETASDQLRTLNSQSVVITALSKNVAQVHGVLGER
ncbi:hypothetical protein GCM10011608_09330 [Micromonospora sonchi]|uniref:Uncharacterized protein n=1 Tax=Micromonospora sonchi TaxID=1763543 RepID=A0A917TKK9_9ACTN|nr:hypothetical protein [Micromonospora sonchi]GGM26629.1 hypothetical protein GCM10011608_09330 [Micromonospora sonchi]